MLKNILPFISRNNLLHKLPVDNCKREHIETCLGLHWNLMNCSIMHCSHQLQASRENWLWFFLWDQYKLERNKTTASYKLYVLGTGLHCNLPTKTAIPIDEYIQNYINKIEENSKPRYSNETRLTVIDDQEI